MTRLEQAWRFKGLDTNERAVVMCIADYEDVFGIGNACPSIQAIVEATGLNRRTIQRVLMRLGDAGVVESHIRKGTATNSFVLSIECDTVPSNYSSPTTPTSSLGREVSNPSGLSASRVEITPVPVIGRKRKVAPVRPGQIEDPEDAPAPRMVSAPRLNAGTLGRRLVDGVATAMPRRAGTMTYGAAGGYMKSMLKKGVPAADLAESIDAFLANGDVKRDLKSKPNVTVYALYNSYYQRWVVKRPTITDWDAEAAQYNQEV